MKIAPIMLGGYLLSCSFALGMEEGIQQKKGSQFIDALSTLCARKLEENGVQSYIQQLQNLDGHQAFKAVCVTLLKSNTFSIDERIELLETICTNDSANNNSDEIMNYDVEMHSDMDEPMSDNSPSFHQNCYQDIIAALHSIFRHTEKPTINSLAFDNRTLLHIAVAGNKFNYQRFLVELLLSLGASCSIKDIHGATPFHDAVKSMSIEIVEEMLTHDEGIGALNIPDAKAQTPLHCLLHLMHTASKDYFWANVEHVKKMVQLLCQAGADITLKDKYTQTPLSIAQALDLTTNCGLTEILIKNVRKK